MDKIYKIKELENAYQISKDWNYNGKFTESEYMNKIGKYASYTPLEIADEICEIIRKL